MKSLSQGRGYDGCSSPRIQLGPGSLYEAGGADGDYSSPGNQEVGRVEPGLYDDVSRASDRRLMVVRREG